MSHPKYWSLGAKLGLAGVPFLLLALAIIAITLWVSWQLDGGAAAVNEAGRMRMQAYRLSLSIATADAEAVPDELAEFERSLALLRDGDPGRPLLVPWDDEVRRTFDVVQSDWSRLRQAWLLPRSVQMRSLREDASAFTAHIDALVAAIEAHMSRWTALLHLLQIAI